MSQGPEFSSDAAPSAVAGEIPSAVRGASGRHTGIFLAIAAVAAGTLLLLGRGRSKPAPLPNDPAPMPVSMASAPLRFAATPRAGSFGADRSGEAGSRLSEIRRTSPILILQNAGSSPASAGETSPGTGLPMPQGFHPTEATASHAGQIGDRTAVIAQGKLLDAILETGINTDQPGMLRALVATDTYGDSGRLVILPKGTRLIGQYDSAVSQGQSRVYVVWQRAIRPDGIDITLDSAGTDPLGQAGVDGKVNRHFFTMFGAATLLSIIGATTATLGVHPQDADNSLSAYRSSVAQGFDQAASTVLSVFVRIKPTIKVAPGTAIKVLVARDLIFDAALFPGSRLQVIP